MKVLDMSGQRDDPRLRAEAAAWLAKLHGPERNHELERDFRSWLNASPDYAYAFEQATEVWDLITPASTAGLPRMMRRGDRDSAGDVSARRRRGTDRLKFLFDTRLLATLGVCSLIFAVGLFRLFSVQSYTTGVGEQRIITLADGSRLSLNSSTLVEVAYEKTRRQVFLRHGEAYFEVAKDSARPFTVSAGHETIIALGTTFLVRREPQVVMVTLIDGKVAVADTEKAAHRTGAPAPSGAEETTLERQVARPGSEEYPGAVTLLPGQRLKLTGAGEATIDRPNPEATAAWRRGEVDLYNTTLAAAAAEMNRYERRPIVVDETAVAQLPVSGIFKTGDGPGFAKAVAAIYGLQVVDDGDSIHLRRTP